MNDCNFVKKIILYLYEELSNKETIKLERHLKECLNCQLEVEGSRETVGTFQALEILGPSPSCETAVYRLVREKLILRDFWLDKVRRFPERFAIRMPRLVTAGLSLLILLLSLTLYISHEKAPFPVREKEPRKMAEWENRAEDSIELLAGEVERIKEWEYLLSLLIVEEKISFEEEMVNLEKDIFCLSSKLNAI